MMRNLKFWKTYRNGDLFGNRKENRGDKKEKEADYNAQRSLTEG